MSGIRRLVLDVLKPHEPSIIDLTSLVLGLAGKDDHLEIQGWADTGGGDPRIAAQAFWRDLDWPPEGDSRFQSPEGNLTVEGSPELFVLAVETTVGGLMRLVRSK